MEFPFASPDFFLNGKSLGVTVGAVNELVDWFEISEHSEDDWDGEITDKTLYCWLRKWDSSHGRVRSLESEHVRIFAREMIIRLMSNEKAVIERLVSVHPRVLEDQARIILYELVDGMSKVEQMARGCAVCFWVKGGAPEKQMLEEEMHCCALPPTNPLHREYPHLTERRSALDGIAELQTYSLRTMGIDLG